MTEEHHNMKWREMATVANASSLTEADIICAFLRSEGIDAVVPGQYATQMLSHLTVALNPRGVEVKAPEADAQRARQLLAEAKKRRHEQPPEADEPE